MLMEFLYRFCRIAQPEIGRLGGGIDYSARQQGQEQAAKEACAGQQAIVFL
jgi:hypothetical protein